MSLCRNHNRSLMSNALLCLLPLLLRQQITMLNLRPRQRLTLRPRPRLLLLLLHPQITMLNLRQRLLQALRLLLRQRLHLIQATAVQVVAVQAM